MASRLQATARTVGERSLEGRSPRRLFGPALHRVGAGRSSSRATPWRRPRAPLGSRKGVGGGTWRRQEGRGPERGTAELGIKALKGEAHGRSGASRAGRDGGGRRDEGSQTPDAPRGRGGIRGRQKSGLPFRDRVVGRESSGEVVPSGQPGLRARRDDAGLLRWTSEGARKRRRGPGGFGCRKPVRTITRRASKRRTGGAEPMSARVRTGVPGTPRDPMRGRAGRREASPCGRSRP